MSTEAILKLLPSAEPRIILALKVLCLCRFGVGNSRAAAAFHQFLQPSESVQNTQNKAKYTFWIRDSALIDVVCPGFIVLSPNYTPNFIHT
jgi:hypothetical protein